MKKVAQTTRRHGFTLIEMAVVLMVVGGTVGMMMQAQSATQGADVSFSAHPTSCNAQTREQLVQIRSALDHFLYSNNRYPTPAARNLGINNPGYGKESSGANIDTLANSGNAILYGSLPFQALGLPASYSADCWGDQFTYIVTQSLTVAASNYPTLPAQGFSNPMTVGALTVNGGDLTTPAPMLSSGAYAVISHGETGAQYGHGAVAKNYTGSSHNWCTSTTRLDQQNCLATTGTLFAATFNDSPDAGADFFDDLLIFGAKASSNCNADSYAVNWTVGANNCAGTVAGPITNNSTQSVVTSTPLRTGNATYACQNGTPVAAATPAPVCSVASTVNGSCGASANHSFQLLPTINLCAAGTASLVSDTAFLFHWTCTGSGGGATASCNATPVCACGGITLICTNPRNPFGGLNLLGIQIIC